MSFIDPFHPSTNKLHGVWPASVSRFHLFRKLTLVREPSVSQCSSAQFHALLSSFSALLLVLFSLSLIPLSSESSLSLQNSNASLDGFHRFWLLWLCVVGLFEAERSGFGWDVFIVFWILGSCGSSRIWRCRSRESESEPVPRRFWSLPASEASDPCSPFESEAETAFPEVLHVAHHLFLLPFRCLHLLHHRHHRWARRSSLLLLQIPSPRCQSSEVVVRKHRSARQGLWCTLGQFWSEAEGVWPKGVFGADLHVDKRRFVRFGAPGAVSVVLGGPATSYLLSVDGQWCVGVSQVFGTVRTTIIDGSRHENHSCGKTHQ